jgi:hypothetical protein
LNEKIVLVLLVVVFLGIVAYKIIFSPFSVTIESHPNKILANSSSPVIVRVVALDRLGFRIPFERLDGKFVVREGAEKIEIVRENRDEFIFKTRGSTGRLVILYYTAVVPFPVEILLNIETAALADKSCPELISERSHRLISLPLRIVPAQAGG